MNKLKIGILIHSDAQTAWVYKMLERIVHSDYSEIALVIRKIPSNSSNASVSKWKSIFNHFMYFLYVKFDELFFKVNPSAFKAQSIASLIENAELINVTTKSTALSDRFLEHDLEKIKKYNLDVIIRLSGFKILRGGILNAAKCGVWSFHHGDNAVNRGGPAGVWEVIEKRKETGVVLQILTEDLDGGKIIDKSFSCTNFFSVNRNVNNYYWKALSMVPRNLQKLHSIGSDNFLLEIDDKNKNPYFYFNPLYKKPASAIMFKAVVSIYWEILAKKISELFWVRQWILLYDLNKNNEISKSFFRFKKIIPPKDRFWADPFIITKNGITYVFIEELLYKTDKGHISVFTIDESGKRSEPTPIIETDYHLSYPFVFEDKGTYYMIPETCANKTIELYQCLEFPYKWQLQHNLMGNLDAVDTTIHFHNGKYWMFVNIKENKGASNCDELFLFYANDFKTTSWQAHPMNPIVSDVKKARPAGKIFQYKGALYRPSQDCSGRYGRGMNIQKITELNEINYKEETLQSIYSDWDSSLLATHTINFDERITIIDALHKRFKFF